MNSKAKFYSTRIVFLLSLLLCLVVAAFSQITTGESTDSGLGGGNSVVGTVISPSGQRMNARITVRLITQTRGDRITVSDENGNFSFRGLVAGDYTIVIDKEKDFEPVSQSFNIIQFRGAPSQEYIMSIKLTAKKTSEPKPGVINAELADVPQTAIDLFKKALELSKAGDHKGAIEQLELATTEYPKFMLAYNEMGRQYLRMNALANAELSFKSALKIKPDAFEPLMNHGIVLFLQKRYDEAEPVMRGVVKLNEKSAGAHYFLGQSLANLGRFDEAEKELVGAMTLGGENMQEAHRTLAIIYSSRGDKKNAIAELETYIKLMPNVADVEQLRQLVQKLKGTEATPPK